MKNRLTYILLSLFISLNAFADSSLDWANNIVVNVINVGGSAYVGDDVHCPSVHIHNEQILTGYTTQENDYAPGVDVPVGGTVTMTIPAPSTCVAYGAAGAVANWSVIVGGTALFSRTVVFYNDSTTPAPTWTPVTIYVNGDTCAATNSPPPVYTNFTVCVQNTLTVAATAQWVFNGSVVKSETLQPGAQDCWTTPSIEVSPTPQNFTLTTSCNPQATTVSTDTNGDLNFNNPTYTNTFSGSGGSTSDSGSGGGTFSTGTNGQITFNPPSNGDAIIPNTNSIVWSAGNGTAAQDSTLKQGFDVLHKDLGDLLSGEQILNNTITTFTNQLGQVISQLWQGSNNDTLQLVGAITNLAKDFPTNVTASVTFPTNLTFSISNYAEEGTLSGISNLLARWMTNQLASSTNQFTNSLSGSNSLSLSNYATESTLEGISNLLAWTNSSSEESNQEARILSMIPNSATNGDAASSAAHAIYDGPLSSVDDFISSVSSAAFTSGDPGHDTSWNISLFGNTYDLDPVDNFPQVFSFAFSGWAFLLIALYLFDVIKLYWAAIKFFNAAQTGGVPDLEVFGGAEAFTFGGFFGGNFIGVLVGVIVPAVFLGLWIVAVTFTATGLAVWLPILTGIQSVFTTLAGTTPGSMACHVMFNAFPIVLAINLIFARLVLHMTLAKSLVLASAASRFLFGK